MEAQFDGNVKFKGEINKLDSNELRLVPLGRDKRGRRYWHQMDDECNIRVFREDQDEETWELVSSDKESMVRLIEQLSSNKDSSSSEEEEQSPPTSNEDSNAGSNTNTQDATGGAVEVGPSEAKKSKSESENSEPTEPAETVKPTEPEVSEAIESPVLLVQGEGNGADCDAGNPGDPSQEETHQENATDQKDLSKDTVQSESTEKPSQETQDCSSGIQSSNQASSGDEHDKGASSVDSENLKEQEVSEPSCETVEPPSTAESVVTDVTEVPKEESSDPVTPVAESTESVSDCAPEIQLESSKSLEVEAVKVTEAPAELVEPQPEASEQTDHPVIPQASEPVPGPPDPSVDRTLPVDSENPESVPEVSDAPEAIPEASDSCSNTVDDCVTETASQNVSSDVPDVNLAAESELGAPVVTESLTEDSAPKSSTEDSAPKSSTEDSAPKSSTEDSAPKSLTEDSAPESSTEVPVEPAEVPCEGSDPVETSISAIQPADLSDKPGEIVPESVPEETESSEP